MNILSSPLALQKMPLVGVRPDLVIDGYPEYKTRLQDLDAAQRLAFERMAQTIMTSLPSRMPVRAVLIVGNADVALRKLPAERRAFELQVSQARASSAEALLLERIATLVGHPSGRFLVKTRAVGIGSSHLAVPNASTEAQMRKNRRVEFLLLTENVGEPSCHAA